MLNPITKVLNFLQMGGEVSVDGTIIVMRNDVICSVVTVGNREMDSIKYEPFEMPINEFIELLEDHPPKFHLGHLEENDRRVDDWRWMSEQGLVFHINNTLLHPFGLALSWNYDEECPANDGISKGIRHANDWFWEFPQDAIDRNYENLMEYMRKYHHKTPQKDV